MLWFQRNILQGVFRRLSVGTGIHPENTEVTRVSGPHPVIRIITKFPDSRRRRTNEPDIPVFFIHQKVIIVSVKIGLHQGPEMVAFSGFANDVIADFFDLITSPFFRQGII